MRYILSTLAAVFVLGTVMGALPANAAKHHRHRMTHAEAVVYMHSHHMTPAQEAQFMANHPMTH